MLRLRMLENALGTEHFFVTQTVKLHFFLRMRLTILNDSFDGCGRVGQLRVSARSHRQSREHLIIHGQVIGGQLVRRLVVWALDYVVLRQLPTTLQTERMTTWQRKWLLVVVIVWFKTDATLKY